MLIQMRRGLRANLPIEAEVGEPLFCTDTNELYIGMGMGVPPVKIDIQDIVGPLGSLHTTDKTNVVNAINELFQNVSNGKNAIAAAIADRGMLATGSETFSQLANKIKTISITSSKKKTKLNMAASSTNTVVLAQPIPLDEICTSIIKFTPGPTGVVQYTCSFNNTDSDNFVTNPDVYYDGAMRPFKTVLKQGVYNFSRVGLYDTFETSSIDKTKWKSVDLFNLTNSPASLYVEVQGTKFPILVFAKSDINLIGVLNVESVVWTPVATNNSKALLLMSADSGISWRGYNGTEWAPVDTTNMADVESKAMSATTVAALTSTQFSSLLGSSTTLRFAYFLKQDLVTDTVGHDSIQLKVAMQGTNSIATSSDCSYSLSSDGTTITYNFTNAGTYTITWVDTE